MSASQAPVGGVSRRQFLAFSSLVPAVVLAPSLGSRAAAAPNETRTRAKKIPIGIELYSVRDELQRDLSNTLREVAHIGYEAVEFYAPYFEWTLPEAKNIRSQMDDLGLRCYSTHNHIESFTAGTGFAKAIELNQIIGARQLVLASAPRESTQDREGWLRLCEQLTTATNELQSHGLTAGYHNHQTEWAPLDNGQRVMDVIAANTPPEFVLQLDVGTCLEVGADPVAWIKANPGRIRSVHLKDWAPGKAEDQKSYRVLFGEGVAPWKEITAAVESVGGVEFYLLEQEGSRFSEFETAKRCLATWKRMRKSR